MKKIITALTAIIIASCVGFTAHAADELDRDYIESEIWEEIWLGKGDDGKSYPEASYKHHLLDEWLKENYGSDDYDWTDISELKYEYKDYYRNLIKDWDFDDDRNGNWTIDTEDNSYRFEIIGGKWNMINKNGDTVDMFPIFSTLEDDEKPDRIPAGENNDNGNEAVGITVGGTEKPSESLDNSDGKVSAETSANVSEGNTEPTGASTLPIVLGGAAVVGIGVAAVVMYKKRKTCK